MTNVGIVCGALGCETEIELHKHFHAGFMESPHNLGDKDESDMDCHYSSWKTCKQKLRKSLAFKESLRAHKVTATSSRATPDAALPRPPGTCHLLIETFLAQSS